MATTNRTAPVLISAFFGASARRHLDAQFKVLLWRRRRGLLFSFNDLSEQARLEKDFLKCVHNPISSRPAYRVRCIRASAL